MKYFWATFLREWKRMASDAHYAFCIFLAPAISIAFFLSLMKAGLPTNLPVGIVDEDHTAVTRMLARHLDSFQQTKVVKDFETPSEAAKAMQEGKIYGYFYIPRGTTRDVNSQKLPLVSFYTDFTYIVAGSLVSRDMRMMSELASGAASRKILYAKGEGERQAMAYLRPIVVQSYAINNPWLNYNIYLSNTILPGILGIFVFMITVYSIGLEIKKGTARTWLSKSGYNMSMALFAKLLPQTLLFFLVGVIFDVIIYGIFHFPCHDGIGTMMLVMLCYILACQGMGVLLITLFPTLRLGLSAASLWGIVSFSISGMSYPVMSMDPILQGFSYLFPLRHYFLLYVNSALDGYSIFNCFSSVAWLLGFALLPILCLHSLKKILLTMKYVP